MTPKYKAITRWFIYVAVAVITVFDLWAASKGYDWTISSFLLTAAKERPIIAAIFGILLGHVFWPNSKEG